MGSLDFFHPFTPQAGPFVPVTCKEDAPLYWVYRTITPTTGFDYPKKLGCIHNVFNINPEAKGLYFWSIEMGIYVSYTKLDLNVNQE